jgi:hypothetical protein
MAICLALKPASMSKHVRSEETTAQFPELPLPSTVRRNMRGRWRRGRGVQLPQAK